jgi:hypothetical protein
MKMWRRSACLTAALVAMATAAPLWAQSTAASISGTVSDEQQNVLPGATITIKNVETGQLRSTTSDHTGNYRLVGLAPGKYEMAVELSGFSRLVQSDIVLSIAQEARLDASLKLAPLQEEITVRAEVPLIETTKSELGRTITTKELDELPIAARDFNNLARLAPGILVNNSTGGTGIAASGQTGRNNTFLMDGLSNDDNSVSSTRGNFSVDAIKEFIIVSNNFAAEYGQASGAIVNVLTRSGTNAMRGRGFYLHRDDSLDATPGANALVTPKRPPKAKLEQKIVGGFYGGPIRRDRSFFFGSYEHTFRDQESIVTSTVLNVFRPGEGTNFPNAIRNPQFLGRVDTHLSTNNVLTVRYRLDRDTRDNWYIGGLRPREAGTDRVIENQDLAILDNHVVGSNGINEFRFQFARRKLDWNVDRYCANCPGEARPSIVLGKMTNMPQGRTEDRWQFVNAFTWIVPDKGGDHSFKFGVDASWIGLDSVFHNNLDGNFTFTHDLPFNAADSRTYPAQFTRNTGDPFVHLDNGIYAFFLQDSWKPRPNLTLNLGLRWDYEDVVGISHDKDNWQPRVGSPTTPGTTARRRSAAGSGCTSIRCSSTSR